jgi:hypothetical protein
MHLAATPWANYSNLLMEMFSESPGCIKGRSRYLNINVARLTQSQKMWQGVSDACLHQSHSRPFTCPSLKSVLSNECSVSKPIIILSWLVLKLSSLPDFFYRALFRAVTLSQMQDIAFCTEASVCQCVRITISAHKPQLPFSFFLNKIVVMPSFSNPMAAVRSFLPPQKVSSRGVDLNSTQQN